MKTKRSSIGILSRIVAVTGVIVVAAIGIACVACVCITIAQLISIIIT